MIQLMSEIFSKHAFATTLLFLGVVDDLRSRKVHNELVVILLIAAAVFCWISGGWPRLLQGALGLMASALIFSPLVTTHTVGGGDLKLMLAFGLATSWPMVLATTLLAFIWGALLSLIVAVLRGQGLELFKNMSHLLLSAWDKNRSPLLSHRLQKVPFTIALLFGWLSHLSLIFRGIL